MKKKQYICPRVEVECVKTQLMQVYGPASVPKDPTHAPGRYIGW